MKMNGNKINSQLKQCIIYNKEASFFCSRWSQLCVRRLNVRVFAKFPWKNEFLRLNILVFVPAVRYKSCCSGKIASLPSNFSQIEGLFTVWFGLVWFSCNIIAKVQKCRIAKRLLMTQGLQKTVLETAGLTWSQKIEINDQENFKTGFQVDAYFAVNLSTWLI